MIEKMDTANMFKTISRAYDKHLFGEEMNDLASATIGKLSEIRGTIVYLATDFCYDMPFFVRLMLHNQSTTLGYEVAHHLVELARSSLKHIIIHDVLYPDQLPNPVSRLVFGDHFVVGIVDNKDETIEVWICYTTTPAFKRSKGRVAESLQRQIAKELNKEIAKSKE